MLLFCVAVDGISFAIEKSKIEPPLICLCLLCLCFAMVMFWHVSFHYDLVCYVYVLLCLCFVMWMFSYVYVLLCLYYVMFMFRYAYVVMFMHCYVMCYVLCTELWKHILHLAGKGIKNRLYANILTLSLCLLCICFVSFPFHLLLVFTYGLACLYLFYLLCIVLLSIILLCIVL